jgi:oligopeptide/dipeptide ABC transporter ATP-binding protein
VTNQPSVGATPPLLDVDELRVTFNTSMGSVRAVDGVTFQVNAGEVLGVVGESGSGKSVTMLSVLGLLGDVDVGGSAKLNGKELINADKRFLRRVRGSQIGFIFQDPMTTLNPVLKVGYQLVEALRAHSSISRAEATEIAVKLFEAVGIPDPRRRLKQFPIQLSGGMRQRVMIAIALCNSPQLVVADEPTTALDVTIQAQVLALLGEIPGRREAAVILVTHDLGVIAEVADRVIVMYAGRIVEQCDVMELFDHPAHHYTCGLLQSRPQIGEVRERLTAISGTAPDPTEARKPGCSFQARCERGRSEPLCGEQAPALVELRPGHLSACHFPVESHVPAEALS